jgi:ACT domain
LVGELILTLSCGDRPGIVGAIGSFLARRGLTIRDSQQFGDEKTGLFFMRVRSVTVNEIGVAPVRDGTRGRSSSRTSPGSTTRGRRPTYRPSVATSKRWRSPGLSPLTSSTAS